MTTQHLTCITSRNNAPDRQAREVLIPVLRFMLAAAVLGLCSMGAHAENNGTFPRHANAGTERVLVKWRDDAGVRAASAEPSNRVKTLSASTGVPLQAVREIAPRLELLRLERPISGTELDQTLARLARHPTVEYAVADYRRWAHAVPSDSLFSNQWYLNSTQPAAIDAVTAWDTTTGSAGTVVAVLDTGVRFDHPDLARAGAGGKFLPGYDFVANSATANDGGGRDSDASDPGDWVDSNDLQQPDFAGCGTSDSSWHGTRVSGIIAALSSNGVGIAGTSWKTWILPVRVLGKCGGYDSDILEAMRWAAGLAVSGIGTNQYPANIINLSLGSDTSCPQSYTDVIAEIGERGVLVVASSGNDGGVVSAPANCPGVVAVAALRHTGTKVGFSSLGTDVDIGAPGGNCVNTGAGQPCLFSIDTTTDLGTTTPSGPGYTDQYNFNVGTSFSAPLVVGTAALMHSANARLSPALMTARLQAGAAPFPVPSVPPAGGTCHVPSGSPFDIQNQECVCTTDTCGAGTVDAAAAVGEALRPMISIALPANVTPGETLALDASTSGAACNRSVSAFDWTVAASSGPPPVITGADQRIAKVQAPTSGDFTLRLTITDDAGAQDISDVTVTTSRVSTTAWTHLAGNACPTDIVPETPPVDEKPDDDDDDGGGAWTTELFVLAALLAIRRRIRSKDARGSTRY
jgi:serine protease